MRWGWSNSRRRSCRCGRVSRGARSSLKGSPPCRAPTPLRVPRLAVTHSWTKTLGLWRCERCLASRGRASQPSRAAAVAECGGHSKALAEVLAWATDRGHEAAIFSVQGWPLVGCLRCGGYGAKEPRSPQGALCWPPLLLGQQGDPCTGAGPSPQGRCQDCPRRLSPLPLGRRGGRAGRRSRLHSGGRRELDPWRGGEEAARWPRPEGVQRCYHWRRRRGPRRGPCGGGARGALRGRGPLRAFWGVWEFFLAAKARRRCLSRGARRHPQGASSAQRARGAF